MKKLTICFDFDGVCAVYDERQGCDVFGESVHEVSKLTRWLTQAGHSCILWTCRLATPKLVNWLKENGFVFDSINSTAHNPPYTSTKPVADVYIDDRGINFNHNFAATQCDGMMTMINNMAEEEVVEKYLSKD